MVNKTDSALTMLIIQCEHEPGNRHFESSVVNVMVGGGQAPSETAKGGTTPHRVREVFPAESLPAHVLPFCESEKKKRCPFLKTLNCHLLEIVIKKYKSLVSML